MCIVPRSRHERTKELDNVHQFETALPEGSVFGGTFADALEQGLLHLGHRDWVSYGNTIDSLPAERLIKSDVGEWSGTYVYSYDEGLVIVLFDRAYAVRVASFARSPLVATELLDRVEEALPRLEHAEEEKVSVA